MKISIIGSGNMGRSLGTLWAEQGHQVFFGSRDAGKGQAIAASVGRGAQGGSNDEAAEAGDVLLWTARGILPSSLLSSTAPLADKVILDCNNREIPPNFAYAPLMGESLAEQLAADVPDAHVVKAFNTMAQEVFELSPMPLRDLDVSCFICGDHQPARQIAMTLATEIGFSAIDCGALQSARLLEAMGDFIRFMIGGMGLGPYATLSVHVLPEATTQRLGGRQPSELK